MPAPIASSILLLVTSLVAQPNPGLLVLGRRPSYGPCGGSKEAAQQEQQLAEAQARKGFPGIQATAGDCMCLEDACRTQLTQLSPVRISVKEAHTVFDLRLLRKRADTVPTGVVLEPVASEKEARAAARAIRAHPFVRQIFGDSKLFCRFAAHQQGGNAAVACKPSDWEDPLTDMARSEDVLQVKGDVVVLEQFLDPALEQKGGPKIGEWWVSGYGLSGARVPKGARGWSAALGHPRVHAFMQKHKKVRVEFFEWHNHFVIVREAAESPVAVTVRFGPQDSWFASPRVIESTREGTEYYDPQGWQRVAGKTDKP